MGYKITHAPGRGGQLEGTAFHGRGCRRRAEQAARNNEYWRMVSLPIRPENLPGNPPRPRRWQMGNVFSKRPGDPPDD
jgi:hypothetical protein